MGEPAGHRIGPEPVRLPIDLALSLVFDEHDVLANRRGQLSRWQRQRLVDSAHTDRRRFRRWMPARQRMSPEQVEPPVVVASIGVPAVSPAVTPGFWHVQIGAVRFDLDGSTVAHLDTTQVLRAYTAQVGPGSPALLSAEVIDPG